MVRDRFLPAAMVLTLWGATASEVAAQSITPAADGTNTLIQTANGVYTIQGGSLSSDGANLFHSFRDFGLSSGEIANFLSNSQVQNILGRVVGGNPSHINGLIQVLGGNANLYLMNPAGLVFGPNASLNVAGDFIATTATGIGFGNGQWFDAVGTADYASLVGNPNQFAFDLTQGGTIINGGNLTVNPGQTVGLLANTVVNTGSIAAAEGQIAIAAVPNSSLVRISQPGQLLSLEIEAPRTPQGDLLAINPLDLPALLTGAPDVGLTTQADQVTFTETGRTVAIAPETNLIAGELDVTGNQGGEITVLGQNVGLFNAELDASGTDGSGNIRVGGDYRGQGAIPNATYTVVDNNSSLKANAESNGNGGRVIVWSDDTTQFWGQVEAKGGLQAGDGGFVEVSGKETLIFQGFVDTSATFGEVGQLLLDPNHITIVAGSTGIPSELANNNPLIWGGGTLDPMENSGNQSIGIDDIRALLTANDLTLEANGKITWDTGVQLDTTGFAANRTLSLTAGSHIEFDATDPILAGGAALNLHLTSNTGNIDLQNLTTNGGSLVIQGQNTIDLGNITTNGGAIGVTLPTNKNLTAGTLDSSSSTNGGAIALNVLGNVTVNSLNAQGGSGTGGTINVVTGGTFQATNTFTAHDGLTASISSVGAIGTVANITIEYENTNAAATFDMGAAIATSGTTGAITSRDRNLQPTQSFPARNLGSVNIYAQTPAAFEPPSTPTPTAISPTTPPTTDNPDLSGINPVDLTQTQNNASSPVGVGSGGGSSSQSGAVSFAQAEQSFSQAFNDYFASGNSTGDGAVAGGEGAGTSGASAANSLANGSSNGFGDSGTGSGAGAGGAAVAQSSFGLSNQAPGSGNSGGSAASSNSGTGSSAASGNNSNGVGTSNGQSSAGSVTTSNGGTGSSATSGSSDNSSGSSSSTASSSPQADTSNSNGASDSQSSGSGDSSSDSGGATSDVPAGIANQNDSGDSDSDSDSEKDAPLSLEAAQASLRDIEAITGVSPALVYGIFVPPIGTSNTPQDTDTLFVMLVLPNGDPIVKPVPVNRQIVMRRARQFRRTVTNARNDAYLRPAQELHRWLIEPLQADIEAAGIEHLTFLLDSGLRSLPVAALHNGEQFLIEQYSLSLMPSMALSDLSYVPITQMGLLAMGAEQFEDQEALPAAGVEVEVLTSELWKGKALQDEDFSVDELKSSRQHNPYGMIHLATHGNFRSGTPKDSYIQMGNERLTLDQIRNLGLHSPTVELMVLSACQTALGDPTAELGFAGLAVMAGVKTAVGSLWQINDVGTLGFMSSFYAHLKDAPIKATALQDAQLALLGNQIQTQGQNLMVGDRAISLPPELHDLGAIDLTHPYYWSTFTMIGTPW